MRLATKRAYRKGLLQKLASTKAGAVGGDNETSFEQSLAALGYTFIADRVPKLLEHLVGFQLVDRNDDNTKAVGVFGFRVADAWLYAPVFFLNGELKGNELLYLKDEDMFAPMAEGWINFILNRRPHSLGSPVQGNGRALGVQHPDIRALSMPPYNKSGAAKVKIYPNVKIAGWMPPSDGFKECLAAGITGDFPTAAARMLLKNAEYKAADLLYIYLRQDPCHVKIAMAMCDTYPEVGRLFYQFHGENVFLDALKDTRAKLAADANTPPTFYEKTASSLLQLRGMPAPAIEIMTKASADLSALTDGEAALLARKGYLIRDKRADEETSQAYDGEKVCQTLSNPTESGIFEVLAAPFKFERCLVLRAPHSTAGRKNFLTVLRLDPKSWLNCHSTTIFAKPREEGENAFKKWYDGLESSTDLTKGATYVVISARGEGTVPLRIRESFTEGRYEVSPDDYMDRRRSPHMPSTDDRGWGESCHSCSSPDILDLKTRGGDSFRSSQNTLFVPADHKIIKVKAAYGEEKEDQSTDTSQSEDRYFQPGNILDVQLAVLQKTAAITIRCSGGQFSINHSTRQSKQAACLTLVGEHGLTEEAAEGLIKRAEAAGELGRRFQGRIKYGFDYPRTKRGDDSLRWGGPYSPAYQDPNTSYSTEFGNVPSYESDVQFNPVADMSSSLTDPSTYSPLPEDMPDPNLMQAAQQAGQMGQKEVFDTSVISGLLKSVHQDTKMEAYKKDLLKAMDRLGRILFLFYWHNDEFVDLYGKADTPELEDAVRNSFESLGELVLFLKEKDVEPLLGSGRSGLNVDDTASN